jgi:DNA-directed RNA polymerase specialized sigma24 family protein
MPRYLLHLLLPGQHIAPIPVDADSPADLAAAVHAHARPRLGSRTVDVRLDPAALTGEIHRAGSPAGTFNLELAPEEQPVGPDSADGIRWGWTLQDLDRLARSVVSNNRTWWPAGDREDLYAAAWHGIVEHLYSTGQEPRRVDLMEAGRRALTRDVKDTMRHHGARTDGTNNGLKHAIYWQWAGRAVPSPEGPIVERLALAQILAALTPRQREAFNALAALGDYSKAADMLDVEPQTFRALLGRARGGFRALWHEGETPSKPWGCDRRAGRTADQITGGGKALTRLRRRARAKRVAA